MAGVEEAMAGGRNRLMERRLEVGGWRVKEG